MGKRRIGQFRIEDELYYDRDFKRLAVLWDGIFPVRVEHLFAYRQRWVLAFSEHFQEIEDGRTPPTYEITVESVVDDNGIQSYQRTLK